jgi:CheY-like chemotaxis protein
MKTGEDMPNSLILALNRNQRNLDVLSKILKEEGFEVKGVTSPPEMDEVISNRDDIEMALIDISGFNQTVWESCEHLRKKEIPFLVLSPQHQMAVERQGRMHGAEEVLVKPLVVKELLFIIKSMVEPD